MKNFNMEEEVKILKKLLNHKIFLDEFPGITYVAVDKFGESASKMVRELSKMGGIRSRINIYPLV